MLFRSSSYVALERTPAPSLKAHFLAADPGGSYAVMSKSLMLLLFGETNLDIIQHELHAFAESGRAVLVVDSAMTLSSSSATTAADTLKSVIGGIHTFFPIEDEKIVRGGRQRSCSRNGMALLRARFLSRLWATH